MFTTKVKSQKHNQLGFTLLEMLISIAIFAMIGLAANAVLSTVMKNDEATKEFSVRLKALQQGFGIIERDLGQIVARTQRGFDGERTTSVFQTGDNMLDSETEALVFFRLGWLNPDGMLPRGSLQSVAYVVQDGRLERWYYPYPEPEVGAEPLKSLIVKDVISIEYSFFVGDKWERKVDASTLPLAIAMEVEIEGLGTIERRFLLPKGGDSSSTGSGGNSGGNNGDNSDNSDTDETGEKTEGDDT
ncbi:type II secretion system protein GspJ [Shewanella sp. UCD-FRSSP16_17]|uniref:type II secretion system minor pseudopilin GspJ n=1 Tax=unclassified Shewanella TaxID=196818 RepID=UPI0007EEA843|nr:MULTISPECIES: type II secretion system minor pseudopilin GspJ [unclassified Shewanella]MBQ4891974.1 type II secretion system minor pseudopilin GspJ [Shewanella sp. MMG014]OBT04275.1 type II secretion system protein GspJ [Shewanella sp. UCD-FRSSP16_17]